MSFSRDPEAWLSILDDPAVKPFLLQDGETFGGLGDLLADETTIPFMFDGCAFLAVCNAPGSYEVHSAALPRVRGSYVMGAARSAINFMFCATPAMELVTKVVHGNRSALGLAKAFGFQHEGDRADAWRTAEGLHDVGFYALSYSAWVRSADWLSKTGEWFHDLLGETATHAPDSWHDRHVGAAVEMILHGQPDKAVALYSRWAAWAGYAPAAIVERDPFTINIVSHLVTLRGDKLDIQTCQ